MDDDEDEEDYDDIVPGSPPQQLHTRASQSNKQSGEEDWEAEDESEKIYEVLPGTRGVAIPRLNPHPVLDLEGA